VERIVTRIDQWFPPGNRFLSHRRDTFDSWNTTRPSSPENRSQTLRRRSTISGSVICDLPCGCLGFSGTLPKWLSQSLERALKTIDAELAERAEEQELDNEAMDSVRELLLRLGLSQTADD